MDEAIGAGISDGEYRAGVCGQQRFERIEFYDHSRGRGDFRRDVSAGGDFDLGVSATGHRYAEFILVAGIFWAIVSAGCLIAYTNARLNWSAEYQLRIESGYGDPQNTSGAPALPVILWSGLGLAYAGLLGWGILGKGKQID